MAFQPIIDLASARTTTFEALVRGPNGESAWSILSQVTDDVLYSFDQDRRRQALLRALCGLASELNLELIAEGVETREEALWLAETGRSMAALG